jgi:hypothetical protein
VTNTTTISRFVNLQWKTFVSQLLCQLFYFFWYQCISYLSRDRVVLIAAYCEAAEHTFH